MTSIKRTHDVQEHPKLPDVLTLEHRFPKRSTTNSSTSCRNSSTSALDAPDAPDAPVCRDARCYTHVIYPCHAHVSPGMERATRTCPTILRAPKQRLCDFWHALWLLKLTSTMIEMQVMCTSSYGHFTSLVLRKKTKLRQCSEKFSFIVCPFP